jgi:hypothetical protein
VATLAGWRGLPEAILVPQGLESPRMAAPAGREDMPQICWTNDFLKKSKCSKASPVPSATQFNEFSAT